jgi:hypothetical protein
MVSQERILRSPGTSSHKESFEMPKTKEFSVPMEDEPGTLAQVCRALADGRVNILAFQSFPWEEGESLVRFVVDNPTTAKSILNTQKLKYTETEVAQAKLPHRPGELARAASQLGEADINIDYAYCGNEAGTNAPLLIFGVVDVGRAVTILDKAAAAAAAGT